MMLSANEANRIKSKMTFNSILVSFSFSLITFSDLKINNINRDTNF